jgi:hypothetical protein
VTETQDAKAVTDLALRLHPDTDTVAIITGKSDTETFWLGELHSELLHYRNKVKEVDLVDLPTDQILQRVDQLPPKTIVFLNFSHGNQFNLRLECGMFLPRSDSASPLIASFPINVWDTAQLQALNRAVETKSSH